MSFSLTQLNASLLIPMLITLCGGITLLGIGVFHRHKSRELYVSITLLFVLLNAGFLLLEGKLSAHYGFFNLLLIDGISLLTQLIILTASALLLLFFMRQNTLTETQSAEFYALLLFSIVGFSFMVSSKNLILILLGLECASLCIYAMIAMQERHAGFEAALKYFIMGAVASAFYALGAMCLYAATGSIDIDSIARFIHTGVSSQWAAFLSYSGLVFLLCALGFKVSLVPFHTWGPDVYQGSNSLLAAFIAISPKVASFAVFIRIFTPLLSEDSLLSYLTYALVVISMSVPNFIALIQKDVKRMLAYSSISHTGFILAAILVLNTPKTHGLVFAYWIFFMFANIGAFGILWILIDSARFAREPNHSFESFNGLIKTSPALALLLSLFMFALAGVPPFCVFWGKMSLMQSAIEANDIFLAVLMALNSAVAGLYYLRLVVHIFIKEPKEQFSSNQARDLESMQNLPHTYSTPYAPLELSSKIALAITFLLSIGSVFMAQNLLTFTSNIIG